MNYCIRFGHSLWSANQLPTGRISNFESETASNAVFFQRPKFTLCTSRPRIENNSKSKKQVIFLDSRLLKILFRSTVNIKLGERDSFERPFSQRPKFTPRASCSGIAENSVDANLRTKGRHSINCRALEKVAVARG